MTDKTEKELYEVFENFNKSENTQLSEEQITHLIDCVKLTIVNNSYINKVEEFMITFNQEINSKPITVVDELTFLRLKLILEELCELAQSCNKNVYGKFTQHLQDKYLEFFNTFNEERSDNLKEKLDALLDLQYVLSGAVSTFGFGNVFDEAFEDVHQSNMSKVCRHYKEAELTQNFYSKQGINTNIIEDIEGKFLILRDEDKKVLKSINYKKVELDKYL